MTVMSWSDPWDMTPWQMFAVGLGLATILLVIIYFVIVSHYRAKRMRVHKIIVCLDGGVFQGSNEDLVFKAKLGSEVDITRIVPTKEGYKFNGFNVYKRFVTSTISKDGISKSTVTSEQMDGMGKDVITMPDYDLYLVAKYSPLPSLPAQNLSDEVYWNDFLTFDDLIADLKHLNYNAKDYPQKLHFREDERFADAVFVFKEQTLIAIIRSYKGISKVYLRTPEDLESKLLSPFYQEEDINDAMNWYSFVVTYFTKPSRFINSFTESYQEVDSENPTSEIEFELIVGSLLTNLADPILDRALALTEQYERDRLLPTPPDYVLKRELPTEFDSDSEERKKILAEEAQKAAEEAQKPQPVKEEEKPVEKPAEPEPKPEVKPQPAIVEEKKPAAPAPAPKPAVQPVRRLTEEEIILAEIARGHYIQPKRETKYIPIKDATFAEKRSGVQKYWAFHPEAEAAALSSSEFVPAAVEPEPSENSAGPLDVEAEFKAGHYIQPKRDTKYIHWDQATKKEKRAAVDKYYFFHPDEYKKPLASKPVAELQPAAALEPGLDPLEAEYRAGRYIQVKRNTKYIRWDKATQTEKRNAIEAYYRQHPEVSPSDLKSLASKPQEDKPAEPAPVSPEPAPEGNLEEAQLDAEFKAGHYIQPKRNTKYIHWQDATLAEKQEAVRKFFALHPEEKKS
jgi:hypothetical protein